MSEHVYLITILLPLLTILIIFAMKYWSAAVKARTDKETEAALRALTEQAVAAQNETAVALAEVKSDLARLSASVSQVETILKQVG